MRLQRVVLLLGVTATTACLHRSRYPAPVPRIEGETQTAFALRYVDFAIGGGAEALPAKCYYVHYTGWLTDGKQFDSSRERQPLGLEQGRRQVIPGWDAGFEGMKVGGKRRLIIPYQLAYGVNGRPPVIPPKATLIFDVELMDVRDAPPAAPPPTPGQPPAPTARCPPFAPPA